MKFLLCPVLQLLSRLVLGGIFIYASLDKIVHPQAFAQAIANYKVLLVPWQINLAALILPWMEGIAGTLLVLGLWGDGLAPACQKIPLFRSFFSFFQKHTQRGAWLVLSGLTVFFIVLLMVTIFRGIDINCGCFGSAAASKIGWGLVWRDALLLIPSAILYAAYRRSLKATVVPLAQKPTAQSNP